MLLAVLVFLSYSHAHDAALASGIKARLEAAGCEVWLDRERIRPREDWRRAVERAIARADVVIELGGADCRGCRFEAGVARARRKRVVYAATATGELCR